MTAVAPTAPVTAPPVGRPAIILFRRAWGQARTKIGVLLVVLLVALALVGPFFAPHSPTEFAGAPYAHPSSAVPLGTDNLGRDVLSRFLWGGRSILGLSLLATALGLALGVSVGLVAAYARSVLDDVLMRAMDVILAFPSIVLVVGLTTMPRVARVTRGASLEIVERDFVQAAEVLGESRVKILFGEILPSITSPLMVEASLRLTYSIGLIAGMSFLGFGIQPPAADWGLMINENRQALTIQPWGAVMPVIAIALLTIGTSLVGDGVSRAALGIEGGGER
jgi:peptide/nickel transport system permease protein